MSSFFRKTSHWIIFSLAVAGFLFGSFKPVFADTQFDNSQPINTINTSSKIQSLDTFAVSVQNGRSNQLVGIFVPDVMSLKVVQQPSGNAAYVSTRADAVTQFGLASQYGSTGILAHNTLAGRYFYNLSVGDLISLVYGDGSIKMFHVDQIQSYQALDPYSAYSNFVDLSNPGAYYTSTDLFYRTYGLGNVLVMQTCIERNGNSSWGRMFIIASPVSGEPADYYSSYAYGKISGVLNLNSNSLSANY